MPTRKSRRKDEGGVELTSRMRSRAQEVLGEAPALPAHENEDDEGLEKAADVMQREMLAEPDGPNNFFQLAINFLKKMRPDTYETLMKPPSPSDPEFRIKMKSHREKYDIVIKELYEVFQFRKKSIEKVKKFYHEVITADFAITMEGTEIDVEESDHAVFDVVTAEITKKLLVGLEDGDKAEQVKDEIEEKIADMEKCERLMEQVEDMMEDAKNGIHKYGMNEKKVAGLKNYAEAAREVYRKDEAFKSRGALNRAGRAVGRGIAGLFGAKFEKAGITDDEAEELRKDVYRLHLDEVSQIDAEVTLLESHLEHITTINQAQEDLRAWKKKILTFADKGETVLNHFRAKLATKMAELLPAPGTGTAKPREALALHERMKDVGGTTKDEVHYLRTTYADSALKDRIKQTEDEADQKIKDETARLVIALDMSDSSPEQELFNELRDLINADPEEANRAKKLVLVQLAASYKEYVGGGSREKEPNALKRSRVIYDVMAGIENKVRSWDEE